MSMRKFKLGKLLEKVKEEQRSEIVAIVGGMAQEKGVDVVDLDAVRRDTTETVDIIKAAPKFEGEPKIESGSRVFPIIVSTRQIDRDNEIVMPRGLDMSEWKKTGVIIPGHDYSQMPIGKAVWVGVNDYGVKMHIEAAPTEEGEKLLALAKFMPLTASIGMGPGEFLRAGTPEFNKATRKMLNEWPEFNEKILDQLTGIISKAVLWEVSIVSVPANSNAVQTALAKAAISDDERKIIRKTLDLPEPEPQADPKDERIKQLESEIRDLKAKVDQLITEKAESKKTHPKHIEKVPSIEPVGYPRIVEVVKSPDVEAHTKLAVDIVRGRV